MNSEKGVKNIEWYNKNLPLQESALVLANEIPFKLPSSFIELLKISNGGDIEYDFDYYDEDRNKLIEQWIGQIYGIGLEDSKILNKYYDPISTSACDQQEYFFSQNCIIQKYYNPAEFFPGCLVAFAVNGGGDYICFDYRSDSNTDNPPIVYWSHGADEGKDVSFIAKNFEEFIDLLKKPDNH